MPRPPHGSPPRPGPLDAKLLGVLAGGTLDLAGLCLGGGDDLGRLGLGLIHYFLGPVGRVHQHLLSRPAGLLDDVGHMCPQVAERRVPLASSCIRYSACSTWSARRRSCSISLVSLLPHSSTCRRSTPRRTTSNSGMSSLGSVSGCSKALTVEALNGGPPLGRRESRGNANAACSRWAAGLRVGSEPAHGALLDGGGDP